MSKGCNIQMKRAKTCLISTSAIIIHLITEKKPSLKKRAKMNKNQKFWKSQQEKAILKICKFKSFIYRKVLRPLETLFKYTKIRNLESEQKLFCIIVRSKTTNKNPKNDDSCTEKRLKTTFQLNIPLSIFSPMIHLSSFSNK